MVDILIERMGEKGDGLAHGRAFPRTLPGERLDEHGRVIVPSPDRIAAFCPVFDSCGGCKLQHWQSEPYQVWKTSLLISALKARAIETEIKPFIDGHGLGRRRVSLHVREIDGRWRAGFMAEGSHSLVPIERCPILVPRLQAAPEIAARFGTIFGDCDVSISALENGLDIAIKATRKLADKATAQFDGMMRELGIARIALNGETRAQLSPPIVKMGKALVSLPIGTFLQATDFGQESLARLVAENTGKAKRVLDLFAGVGPFTFKLAETRAAHAIDSDKPAIAALQAAVRATQGLKPITAEARDLFRNPLTMMELNEFDCVVLDPPRAGTEAQCHNIAKSKVKRVIYVSCDVQSFAHDAAQLIAGGYHLNNVTPLDQFLYSAHLECVALFTRR